MGSIFDNNNSNSTAQRGNNIPNQNHQLSLAGSLNFFPTTSGNQMPNNTTNVMDLNINNLNNLINDMNNLNQNQNQIKEISHINQPFDQKIQISNEVQDLFTYCLTDGEQKSPITLVYECASKMKFNVEFSVQD